MSFFGKIKDNLNHGGVDVDIEAPASASMEDATFPVIVSITNTSQQQHLINRVTAEIYANSNNSSFNNSPGQNSNDVTNRSVAKAEDVQQFAIQPNETKKVQVNIVLNAGNAATDQLPDGSGIEQVAGMLGKLQSIGQALDNNSYTYNVTASVDVEGISLDPAKSQPIQLLKPGQIGTAFNF